MNKKIFDHYRFRVLVLYAALSPLIAFRISGNAGVGITDILLVLALPFLVLIRGRRLAVFELPYLFFLLFALLSFLWHISTAEFQLSNLSIIRLLSVPTAFFIVFRIRNIDSIHFDKILNLFLLSGGLAVILGVAMYHLGIDVGADQQRLWVGGGYNSTLRAGGFLGNSGSFGHIAAVWGTTCAACIAAGERKNRTVLVLAILLLSIYATYISSSRAALLHILLGLTLSLPVLLKGLNGVTLIGSGVALIGGLPILLPRLLDSPTAQFSLRRLDIFNLSGSSRFYDTVRFESWSKLLEFFSNTPWLGIGHRASADQYGLYADNSFIRNFAELGVFSGVSFAIFWIVIFVAFLRSAISGNRWGWVGFAIVGSEITHALSLDTHTLWYSMPVAMLFIALLLRKIQSPSSRKRLK